MRRSQLAAASLALSLGGAALAAEAATSPEHLLAFKERIAPFVQTYCVRCHNADKERGGLRLDVYTDHAAIARDHATWTMVLEKLKAKDMPPKREEQPPATQRVQVIQWIQAELANDPCDGRPRPGRVTLRRLNRAEYDNTIRDLFGVQLDLSKDFPADDSGYGFDNIGDVLSVSPLLMENYLTAAERVAQAVIMSHEPPPPVVKRVSGARLARGGKPRDADDDEEHTLASNGEIGTQYDFPSPGTYTIRVRAYGHQAGPEAPRMACCLDGKDIGVVDVKTEEGASEDYVFQVLATRGPHRLSVKFLNDYYEPKHNDPKLRGDRNLVIAALELEAPREKKPAALPESHRRTITCTPGVSAASRRDCARRIVREVARRAFRRPVEAAETEPYVALVTRVVEDGGSFEQGIQLALQAILVSPSFLFLVESEPSADRLQGDSVYRLTDHELASRLSYFLWSSMPDEELFALADAGRLHDDQALAQQVGRMLKDPRSRALAENFAGQWLGLRKLEEVTPDPRRFKDFDDALRKAMAEESRRFFEFILREDRSILEFVLADYTFVNDRLARHYGMGGIEGVQFRKVSAALNRPGGLLGQASILTVTSDPTRTSPVKRGKWVLEQLLGTPPPPPPDDVPSLDEGKGAELKGTLRQRMEQHRTRADCKSCHAQMDPIGFGLENYDAIGAWRQRDGESEVDASGALPTGESFRGPAELQRILLARRDLFRKNLARKLLTYALGRGIEYQDRCAIEAICERVAAADDRFSVLITEIVKSPPFRMRSLPEKDS